MIKVKFWTYIFFQDRHKMSSKLICTKAHQDTILRIFPRNLRFCLNFKVQWDESWSRRLFKPLGMRANIGDCYNGDNDLPPFLGALVLPQYRVGEARLLSSSMNDGLFAFPMFFGLVRKALENFFFFIFAKVSSFKRERSGGCHWIGVFGWDGKMSRMYLVDHSLYLAEASRRHCSLTHCRQIKKCLLGQLSHLIS